MINWRHACCFPNGFYIFTSTKIIKSFVTFPLNSLSHLEIQMYLMTTHHFLQYVFHTSRTAYLELWWLSTICKFLTVGVTQKILFTGNGSVLTFFFFRILFAVSTVSCEKNFKWLKILQVELLIGTKNWSHHFTAFIGYLFSAEHSQDFICVTFHYCLVYSPKYLPDLICIHSC